MNGAVAGGERVGVVSGGGSDAEALATPPERIEQELLDNWDRQPWRVPVPVTLAAGFLVWLPSGPAPLWLSAGWLLLVAGVLGLRWWTLRSAARRTDWPLALRFNAAAVVSGLGGMAHGASIAFWPYMSDIERVVQSMFVIGLSAGAVATEYGHRRLHLPYMLPTIVPTAVAWTIALGTPGQPWWQGSGGVMLVMWMIYIGLLVTLARDTYALYVESFETRRRLSQALANAESANRAKTRFLAAASHDLRQPLHTLSLFGAALSTCTLDARSRAITVQMNAALRALGSELDALLDISRLDAGIVAVESAPFALNEMLRRLGSDFAPLAQRKGLHLALDLPEAAGAPLAQGDPGLVERVLRNLIDNAVKYTERGDVLVSLRAQIGPSPQDGRDVPGWRIEVRDTGPGIAESEQQRVFEEFYQLGNPERDRTQGLGLGLAIVHRLCELMKTPLALHSTLGQGTRFELWLPASAAAPADAMAALAPAMSFAGLDVLVIDDEEAVREGMHALLEAMGCRVATAAGCADALALAERSVPGIVLADFRLRGNDDGIRTILALRERHGPLPALLISGDTAPERLREAHAAGLRLLHKPLAPEQLMLAMGETLHESIDGGARG